MRIRPPHLLGLLGSALTVLAAACGNSHAQGAPDPPTDVRPTPTQLPTCEAQAATVCRTAIVAMNEQPSHDGAILWAKTSGKLGLADVAEMPTVSQLAVYADGMVRRTPVLRNIGYADRPPRAQIVAVLSADALSRLRADLAALPAEAGAGWLLAGVHVAQAPDPSTALDVLDVGGFHACLDANDGARCAPGSLGRARAAVAPLFAATEAKWRAARVGTVSLGEETDDLGPWPLDEGIANDGLVTVPAADAAKLQGTGVFRLTGGDFVAASVLSSSGDTRKVFLVRMSAYVLDDADLRARLLAEHGRYVASNGEWLGIELAADRFPAAKNRELAIVPATGQAPARMYRLFAIEHFDLREDGPITL